MAEADKKGALLALLERERSTVRSRVQGWHRERAARRAERGIVCGAFLLRVKLRGAQPPVTRDITVPADASLLLLHCAVQASMGWIGRGGFYFELPSGAPEECGSDGEECGLRVADLDSYTDGEAVLDARTVQLCDVLYPDEGGGGRRTLQYLYDHDRCWEHELELLHPPVSKPAPACRHDRAEGDRSAVPLAVVGSAPPPPSRTVLASWCCLGGSGAPLPEAFGLTGVREMRQLCAALLDESHARHGAATAFAHDVMDAATATASAAGPVAASVPTLAALLRSLSSRVDADAVTARLAALGRQHAQLMRELAVQKHAVAAADAMVHTASSSGGGGSDSGSSSGSSDDGAATGGGGGPTGEGAAELDSLRAAGVISEDAHLAATHRLRGPG